MAFSKDVVASWASNCGFKDHGNGLYRGGVHPSYRDSVALGLESMGLTLASVTNAGTEIWASPDDAVVVLVKYN